MAVLDAKKPAFQATTAPISVTKAEALALEGKAPLAVDGAGVQPVGRRLLLKDQAKTEQNGLFEVTKNECFAGEGKFAGTGNFAKGDTWALKRPEDADTGADVTNGMLVPVEDGETNADTSWIQRTADPIEVGVTAQTFEALVAGARGVAGGDLSGTYSKPSVAEAVIDNTNVSPEAAIGYGKLDLVSKVAASDLATSAKELAPQLVSAGITKINAGTVEVEYPGGSVETTAVEVSHGLGQTPVAVVLTGEGSDIFSSRAYTATKFTSSAHIVEGVAPGKGVKVKARWMAFG